jgi:hypothetical protein
LNGVKDTTSYTKDKIALPSVGFKYTIPVNAKIVLSSGLGLSYMGNANYYNKVDTSIINYPGVLENIKLKPHFIIGYLRIPISVEYKLTHNLFPFIGYSLNYSVRKNQNFWAAEIGNVLSYKNIYSNYHHALIFGLLFKVQRIEISANLHKGISKIWDTENYYKDKRAYLTLNGIQLTVGYILSD